MLHYVYLLYQFFIFAAVFQVAPFEKRDEADSKKKEFAVGNSDHLTMLKAYRGWTEAARRGSYAGYCYCQENFLSIKNITSMRYHNLYHKH